MRQKSWKAHESPKAPLLGKYVESYGALGAPFLSFFLSKYYRTEVIRIFRRAAVIEKIEMILLGIIHTCFAALIAIMLGGVLFVLGMIVVNLFKQILSLF